MQEMAAGRCTSCGTCQFPKLDRCRICWTATVEVLELSVGTVESYTTVYRAPEGFETPYALASAVFKEGVRVLSRLEAGDQEPRIGMAVRLDPDGPGYAGLRLVAVGTDAA